MNGTIVYSVSEVPFKFNIVPSPLHAVIYGGLQRNVCRNGTAIFDATSSIDPDFPNSRNMKFVSLFLKLICCPFRRYGTGLLCLIWCTPLDMPPICV